MSIKSLILPDRRRAQKPASRLPVVLPNSHKKAKEMLKNITALIAANGFFPLARVASPYTSDSRLMFYHWLTDSSVAPKGRSKSTDWQKITWPSRRANSWDFCDIKERCGQTTLTGQKIHSVFILFASGSANLSRSNVNWRGFICAFFAAA